MHQRVAQTLRYLATFIDQGTARTNAAEGSAAFRKRRQDVDEYLQGRAAEHIAGAEADPEALKARTSSGPPHDRQGGDMKTVVGNGRSGVRS